MTEALFRKALGEAFDQLPEAVRRFHDGELPKHYSGMAEVTRGPHPIARLCATLFGLPKANPAKPVRVTVTALGNGERWVRDFGGHSMQSTLAPGPPGAVQERFGVVTLRLALALTQQGLSVSVSGVWVFGLVPLPRALWPISASTERQAPDGGFAFDISGALPGIGPVIRYRGVLRPDATPSNQPL